MRELEGTREADTREAVGTQAEDMRAEADMAEEDTPSRHISQADCRFG